MLACESYKSFISDFNKISSRCQRKYLSKQFGTRRCLLKVIIEAAGLEVEQLAAAAIVQNSPSRFGDKHEIHSRPHVFCGVKLQIVASYDKT